MFTWKKEGLIFNPLEITDRTWLKEFAQAPSVLIFENFVRVFFSCRPPADTNGKYVSYSAYVDLDRNDLSKVIDIAKEPVLELGGLGTFDEFGIYPFSVIRKENLLRAYYGGWTRCESVPFNVAIGVAESDDEGKTFRKLGEGPVLSYSLSEPFILSSPKIRKFNGKWYLFYIAGKEWILDNEKPEPVYQIRMATSDDGLSWTKLDKDIIETVLGKDECQASPDVIYYEGLYHMFFSYRHSRNYRNKQFGYRLGYASSENLIDWTRNDKLVGITVSDEGWDSEMISYAHVFELDKMLYMLYLGNQVGRSGFGLAKLESYTQQL